MHILVLGCALAMPSAAQDWAGRGRVQGEVTTEDGRPIEGATVRLSFGSEEDRGPEPFTTGRNGRWSYLGLRNGLWAVRIEKEEYVPSEGQIQVSESGANPTISVTLQRLEDTAEAQRTQEVLGWLEEAGGHVDQGRYAEARELYERALDQTDEVGRIELERAIARTYVAEEDHEQALETLQSLAAASPGDVETLRLLAVVQGRMGQTEPAMATLRRLLELAPDDADALELMANLLVSQGREEEAEAYLARLPEGRKVDPDAYLNLGIEQYNQGEYAKALEYFDRVIEEYPESTDVYYYRAMAHLSTGNTDQAMSDLQKLLDLDPDHERAAEAREFLEAL